MGPCQQVVGDSDAILPNPYGEDSSFGQVSESALERRVRIRDSQRSLWTRISILRGTPELRILLSLVGFVYSILMLSEQEYANDEVGLGIFAVLSMLFVPTLLASSFAQMSARDRMQLKIGGNRSMESYPGVERILNTLHERVLRERTRILCVVVSALAINSTLDMDRTDDLASILYSLVVFLAGVSLLNTLQLMQRTPMTEEDFPLLSLHAPALHHSTLDWVLSDLLVAHLDPETAGAWDDWMSSLEDKVRVNQNPKSAVEHLLRVLHLNHLELLDDDRLISEAKKVFRVAAIDGMKDDESTFNINSLRRLMAHTRAWQPGLFRLIDRLQDAAMKGHSSLTENSWRLDLDLPPRCSQGQGDLFIMIHNHTKKESSIEVEIIAADGEPGFQTLGLSPPLSKKLKGPAILGAEENGLVEVLGKLIDGCLVLWIGLAWPSTTSGSRPVQVNLRGPGGETLSSLVVTTSLSTGFNPEGAAERMIDAAVAVRRLSA